MRSCAFCAGRWSRDEARPRPNPIRADRSPSKILDRNVSASPSICPSTLVLVSWNRQRATVIPVLIQLSNVLPSRTRHNAYGLRINWPPNAVDQYRSRCEKWRSWSIPLTELPETCRGLPDSRSISSGRDRMRSVPRIRLPDCLKPILRLPHEFRQIVLHQCVES